MSTAFWGFPELFPRLREEIFGPAEFLSAIPGRIVRVRAGYAQKARKEAPDMKEKNRNQNENQNERNNQNNENREQNQNQNQQNRSQR